MADEEVIIQRMNSFSGSLKVERSSSPKVRIAAEVVIDLKNWEQGCQIVVDGMNKIMEEALKKDLLPI